MMGGEREKERERGDEHVLSFFFLSFCRVDTVNLVLFVPEESPYNDGVVYISTPYSHIPTPSGCTSRLVLSCTTSVACTGRRP